MGETHPVKTALEKPYKLMGLESWQLWENGVAAEVRAA